ncbi:hypothetical protein [Marinobacterium litorale]|uniref:hypothetical protein n=1 Tax=Marinobacterium litorale TaxID=404770 RepID=UPI0003FC6D04|nr:hypothetical protein [Marinobacterium litorale]
MLLRLFQRAGAIGAASVALFVSMVGSAYAYNGAAVNVYSVNNIGNDKGYFEADYHFQKKWAADDPNFPGKTAYVKKRLRVPKRGNPLSWVKKNPLEIAVTAAVFAAGWSIDELTGQVVRPAGTASYWANSYYETRGQTWFCQATTIEGCAAVLPSSNNVLARNVSIVEQGDPSSNTPGLIRFYVAEWGTWHDIVVNFEPCTDPVGAQYCAQQTGVEVVPDQEVWEIVDAVADEATQTQLRPWVTDPNGNPYIYPEVADAQDEVRVGVPGAAALPEAAIVNNPLEGQGLGIDGMPVEESPTPEVETETPFELPTDYAREQTLQEAKTQLEESKGFLQELKETLVDGKDIPEEPDIIGDSPADEAYKNLTDEFDTLPDMPDLGINPDVGFQSSGTCETITFNWDGASVVFPSTSQCSKLQTAQDMLGWFIYVLTFFGIVHIILGARKGAA